MTQINKDSLILAGRFSVDSGQAMVGDPCYLDDWDTNRNEDWNLDGKLNQYSYHGASATTIANNYGELGNANSVVFSTGYGDGLYPVYVVLNGDNRVSKVIIDFEGDLDEEQE
jgi:hypothetical protein